MMVSTMVLVGWRYLSVSDARHIFLGKYLLTEHTVLHSITLVTMTTKIVLVCRLSLSIDVATMDENPSIFKIFWPGTTSKLCVPICSECNVAVIYEF